MSHLRSGKTPEDPFGFLFKRRRVFLFMRPCRPVIKIQLRLIDRRWSTGAADVSVS